MRKPDWKIWLADQQECKSWLERYLTKGILRKKADESRLYLKKADHNLALANWILEKHKQEIPQTFGKETFYDWTVNMYYYAIYHAATAIVSREGYASSSHSATLCFLIFNHYHQKKVLDENDVFLIVSSLDKKDIETIGSSKEMRERASYDVHATFEKAVAEMAREDTMQFIVKVKTMFEHGR
jgi:uncharacterized protein (UPF0332 family)